MLCKEMVKMKAGTRREDSGNRAAVPTQLTIVERSKYTSNLFRQALIEHLLYANHCCVLGNLS